MHTYIYIYIYIYYLFIHGPDLDPGLGARRGAQAGRHEGAPARADDHDGERRRPGSNYLELP